ncbi:MAG: class I SAM-dependent DNA methyltransferase, partial [Thermoleophilia bacterium]|nr:class I SAM-dependent DNA methyltransferase [Thermoleophilia bacterium]
LLEGVLSDRRQELGAHYTAEADIQKIVQPSIVEPWTERIENITTHKQAVAAQNDLMNYVVLDPACGSGNFLYVAYQELRRIEKRLREREAELRRQSGKAGGESLSLFFPLSNMKGIEIDGFAVALARVTLWMGHTIAVRNLDLDEATLPLADLSGIQQHNALRTEWPRADVIIGNPPFHGSQNLRREIGDTEIEFIKREFGIGVKDFCVYWFRKAHDHLEPGKRAGLVATNSVSQNRMRSASLDYIVDNGGVITNAVSKQPWSGDAVVNVSIIDWIKQPTTAPKRFVLDSEEVDGISSSLSEVGTEVAAAARLAANKARSFQGPKPVGKAYIIDAELAQRLIAKGDEYRAVVRPYLIGENIGQNPGALPTRWCIDFGMRPLEDAMTFTHAYEALKQRVESEGSDGKKARDGLPWWRFERPRPAMRSAIADLPRYIAGTATGKRILFVWADKWTCPSNATNVFAFADDYSFGVLNSRAHIEWARSQSSTMRTDIRYTPTTAFETFPWPQPTDAQREVLADIARRLDARRREICTEREIGLTTLYNQVDEGAWVDLKKLHIELDEAVAVAYGWPKSAAHDTDESNRLLLELNRAITAGEVEYDPFGS